MNFVACAWLPGCALTVWGAEDLRGRQERATGPEPPELGEGRAGGAEGVAGDPEPRTRGRGTRYLPVEQGVVVHGGGGGVVWRRGQRQQRQEGLARGLPAGKPREQRGGGGLGRG